MRRTLSLAALWIVWAVSIAAATPHGHKPPVPKADWDSKGWTLLGERDIDGSVDHARIVADRVDGKLGKLTIVVENFDLELVDFKLTYRDKTDYHPSLAHHFMEGQRWRTIDLPPTDKVIAAIDFAYKNAIHGFRAHVQVWALPAEPTN